MLHNISLISQKMPLISLILPLSFHKPHATIYTPTPNRLKVKCSLHPHSEAYQFYCTHYSISG